MWGPYTSVLMRLMALGAFSPTNGETEKYVPKMS